MSIPERIEVKQHLLQLLEERGSISVKEAYAALAAQWRLTDQEMAVRRAGGPLYEHEIRWARQELVVDGIMDRPGKQGRGQWKLRVDGEFDIAGPEQEELRRWPEGAVLKLVVNKYERSASARRLCIAIHGVACKACGVRLEDLYGLLAAGRIHVHHVSPLSALGENYQVDPVLDLIPLCPNCHFVAHLQEPPLTAEQLRSLLQGKQVS